MNDTSDKALLPAGLRDVLPPAAAFEARVVEGLMAVFAAHGYERVKPPLIEFEQSLLAGAGAATAPSTFRLMDPVSQRMMGVRPDITLQVARIATTRLAGAPRPLRLGYAGQVLRVKGSQLRPERQFGQVGIELIGAAAAAADAEVVVLAADALQGAGIAELSVDLGLPSLVPTLCDEMGLDGETAARLRAALDRKDGAAVAALGGQVEALFGPLLDAAGPLERGLSMLAGLQLPQGAAAARAVLQDVAALVGQRAPALTLTVDPVENRGYEYHTGVTCTLFAPGVRGELGRGGRYLAGAQGEPAVGVTLFTDSLLRALPRPDTPARVFVPAGLGADAAGALRAQGWITVEGLEEVADATAEARRLGCSHVLKDGAPVETGL